MLYYICLLSLYEYKIISNNIKIAYHDISIFKKLLLLSI